jgi:hypothetical protein
LHAAPVSEKELLKIRAGNLVVIGCVRRQRYWMQYPKKKLRVKLLVKVANALCQKVDQELK